MGIADAEFRQLSTLVAIADHGTFGRAAHDLGYTQSAISQQVAALERAIGTPMFDRLGGARGVSLTPAGELVAQHARSLMTANAAAQERLDSLLTGAEGTLVIGTFQSISVKVLPEVIRRMKQKRPKVLIKLVENDDQEQLFDQLENNELDLTFAVEPVGRETITSTYLCEDRFVVLCPPGGTEFLRGDTSVIHLDDLQGEPMVGQPDVACQLIIERGLKDAGLTPNYVCRSSDNGTVQAMVRAGMGHAVMAYLATDPNDPDVTIAELEPPIPPRELAIAQLVNVTLSPAAQHFAELVQQVVREMGMVPESTVQATS